MISIKRSLIILGLIFTINAHTENIKINDLSILVSSCDKYKILWPGFFDALFKFWPSLKTTNKNIKIYLITNEASYPDPRVLSIPTKLSDGWSKNIRDALEHTDTKYVLYLQDDYFFSTQVKEDRLQEMITAMRGYPKVAYISAIADGYFLDPKFAWQNNPHLSSSFIRSKEHKKYYVTLQALLFDKQKFLDLLGEEKSPWLFEKKAVKRAVTLPWESWGLRSNPPLEYLNMVDRGQLNLSFLKTAQSLGLTNLPTETRIDKDKIYSQDYPILYNLAFRSKTILSFYVTRFRKIKSLF